MSSNRHEAGFSLLELMIVVAIIGILSMIGMPSYQSYIQKARFTEVISSVEQFKTAVTLALQQGVSLNDLKNGSYGIPKSAAPTKNLDHILVKNGIITASGTKLVSEANYILTPNEDGTVWSVTGSCLKLGFCNG